jgi:hypothetical protein
MIAPPKICKLQEMEEIREGRPLMVHQEELKVKSMNGLRVYINPEVTEMSGGYGVFYSRREGGPYYQWRYEEKLSRWRGARVQSSDFSPRLLSTTNWKVVPPTLQKSMVEHYQE